MPKYNPEPGIIYPRKKTKIRFVIEFVTKTIIPIFQIEDSSIPESIENKFNLSA